MVSAAIVAMIVLLIILIIRLVTAQFTPEQGLSSWYGVVNSALFIFSFYVVYGIIGAMMMLAELREETSFNGNNYPNTRGTVLAKRAVNFELSFPYVTLLLHIDTVSEKLQITYSMVLYYVASITLAGFPAIILAG